MDHLSYEDAHVGHTNIYRDDFMTLGWGGRPSGLQDGQHGLAFFLGCLFFFTWLGQTDRPWDTFGMQCAGVQIGLASGKILDTDFGPAWGKATLWTKEVLFLYEYFIIIRQSVTTDQEDHLLYINVINACSILGCVELRPCAAITSWLWLHDQDSFYRRPLVNFILCLWACRTVINHVDSSHCCSTADRAAARPSRGRKACTVPVSVATRRVGRSSAGGLVR